MIYPDFLPLQRWYASSLSDAIWAIFTIFIILKTVIFERNF